MGRSVSDFRQSSFAKGETAVQVAFHDGFYVIRSNDDVNFETYATSVEWQAFIDGVKAGEFDKW